MSTITKIEEVHRVHVSRGAEEEWPEVPTWSPNFIIRPNQMVIEFNDASGLGIVDPATDGLIKLTVSGERYRLLKAGPAPKGHTSIDFGRCPAVLAPLLRKIALDRYEFFKQQREARNKAAESHA